MATLTINYDASNVAIRDLIAALLKFDGITAVSEKTESPYDPAFVAKIERSQKEAEEGKAKAVKIGGLWK